MGRATLSLRRNEARGSASYPTSNNLVSALEIPPLSIVIVNYRQWDATAELVRQIEASPCMKEGLIEIIIVDNHSPPHPVTSRLRRNQQVSIRRWRRNYGFARAVNEGCRLSRGRWFLLLNPDVSIAEDYLERVLALLGSLDADASGPGIVGFRLTDTDGSRQHSSGNFPTLVGSVAGLLRPRPIRKYQTKSVRRRVRVPWVTGCCLLINRECWDDLAGLDEDFFLYYEDVDFCRRARARGWSVWFEPALQVTHHQPLHLREVPVALRVATRHALLTYAQKHWPSWQTLTLAAIIQAESLFRSFFEAIQGRQQTKSQYREMGLIARDLCGGDSASARRRLNRVLNANR